MSSGRRAPGVFGGNMDVKELCAGSTLYLPVQQAGALFSCGDAHAAQGDGEVCINGIECPAEVTLEFRLHKTQSLAGPMVESVGRDEGESWIVVESHADALEGCEGRDEQDGGSAGLALGLRGRCCVCALQRGQ